jgi:hypothetical protein
MNEQPEATERNLLLFSTWASKIVKLSVFLAMVLFVGHRSFGLPDFGVNVWHLAAIGFGGPVVIWLALRFDNKRIDNAIRGLRPVEIRGELTDNSANQYTDAITVTSTKNA